MSEHMVNSMKIGVVALGVSSSLLLAPPAGAAAVDVATSSTTASNAAVQRVGPVTLSSGCNDGSEISMTVSPSPRAGSVRVLVRGSAAENGSEWRGQVVSFRGGDVQADATFRGIRARRGNWRFATNLRARPNDGIGVTASSGGRSENCLLELGRTSAFGFSLHCTAPNAGLFLVTPTGGPRSRVQFAVGGARPSSRWEMRIKNGAKPAVVDVVRANRQGLIETSTTMSLSGNTLLSFVATGPQGPPCRLSMRRTW